MAGPKLPKIGIRRAQPVDESRPRKVTGPAANDHAEIGPGLRE